MNSQQIPLKLEFPEQLTFENFLSQEDSIVQTSLEQLVSSEHHCALICGSDGTGKTHLTQALYHSLSERGVIPAFIDCSEEGLMPELFDALEVYPLVILDSVDCLLSSRSWQEKLFHLYNRLVENHHHMVLSMSSPPDQIEDILPDLRSRLMSGLILPLTELPDELKLSALQDRATSYGLELTKEVGLYLLSRLPRDMHGLFDTLHHLDKASLTHKRRLTIPFVKEILSI